MTRNELVKWLDKYLFINEVEDRAWNGLQVEGKDEVKKIGFAVDAGIEIFEKADKAEIDFLIVHHGMFWKNWNPSFVSATKNRIEALNENGISLYCAHLPLDRHKEVGNNAQLLKIIGAEITGEFDIEEGKNISWIGEFSTPKTVEEIAEILNKKLNTECKTLPFGKDKIKTVVVCSGAGGYTTHQKAFESGVDLYITGEAIDMTAWDRDLKFNVIFGGHYATEIVGVQALSQVIEKEFNINVEFIEAPTGI